MNKKILIIYLVMIAIVLTTLFTYRQLLARNSLPTEDPYVELREAMRAESDPLELTLDIRNLLSINQDFKGWLRIPGTPVDHPVVQGADNAFYLHHSFSGEPSAFGCLFFDVQSTETARNRVIYGHNMGRGREEVFSSLVRYQEQAYAETHKHVHFTDLAGNTLTYEVFAAINFDTTNITSFDFRTPAFQNDEAYRSFIAYLQARSLYQTTYTPAGEPLLILSTCNNVYGKNNRFLLCCGKIS